MNREQKRAAQKAGDVNADGSPVSVRDRRAPATQRLTSERTRPKQFVREVRSELKKVNWPTKDVVIRYSIIVAVSLVIFTLFVFGIDFVFERFFHFIIAPGSKEGAAAAISHTAAVVSGSY